MLKKIKEKLKKNLEIFGLVFLIFFTTLFTTYFNFKNMYQIIFVAAVAVTAYTNGLSFVFQ